MQNFHNLYKKEVRQKMSHLCRVKLLLLIVAFNIFMINPITKIELYVLKSYVKYDILHKN